MRVGDAHCTPSPFHYIYHHVHSCSVRSSWEGRYTPPISSLPVCTLWFRQPDTKIWALTNHNKKLFRSYLARYRATWWDRCPLPGTLSWSLTMTGLTSVVDPHSLNSDPDPGFWWPKTEEENYSWNFSSSFFDQKWQFTYPLASLNDVQATVEVFKREHPAPCGSFCPPGSGSNLDPDQQHCFFAIQF